MKKEKKILIVISKINYGGAGKMVSFLANNLSRLGHEIIIFTFASNDIHYYLDKNINCVSMNYNKDCTVFKKISPIFKTRKLIKDTNPDVIISFLNNANFISILASFFTKVPVIICERSDPYHENNISLKIMRSFYRFAEGAVFQTRGAKEYYNKIVQQKSKIIPNPVTIKREKRLPFKERKNEIAFVARFNVKQKRQDLMIKAFKKVLKTHKNYKLVFYGDGPDMDKIINMAREYNILKNVIFAGKVNNIQKVLKKSKLFVLTSDYEGIPNALIEAMAVGLPVVTTDCSPGGAELLVKNKVNGIIVPRGNANEIAEAITFLLSNPVIAEELGERAQEIITSFSPFKIIKEWDDYIDGIVKQ